jgi:hypothetical protein
VPSAPWPRALQWPSKSLSTHLTETVCPSALQRCLACCAVCHAWQAWSGEQLRLQPWALLPDGPRLVLSVQNEMTLLQRRLLVLCWGCWAGDEVRTGDGGTSGQQVTGQQVTGQQVTGQQVTGHQARLLSGSETDRLPNLAVQEALTKKVLWQDLLWGPPSLEQVWREALALVWRASLGMCSLEAQGVLLWLLGVWRTQDMVG